jgi:DNA topoisomerase-1
MEKELFNNFFNKILNINLNLKDNDNDEKYYNDNADLYDIFFNSQTGGKINNEFEDLDSLNDSNSIEKNNGKMLFEHLTVQFGGKKKWDTLYHNGVLFPPEYEPQNIPLKCNGEDILLSPEAEEYAMLYAKHLYMNTEYLKNNTFNKNFWKDFKKIDKNDKLTSLDNCDFSNYVAKYEEIKKNKSEMTEDEKKKQKEKEEKYKIAVINGKEEDVGNFRVEPPGLFIGRGDNPNIGKIKKRIYPEDVTINIGKGIPPPETLPGHKWGKIVHNRDVEWIASWEDNITGKNKYVWLSHSSEFKANNDSKKFELARKLKKKIKRLIEYNSANLKNRDIKIKQLATALYLIDKLAIRVGNEKSTDEADTVGVTTLRVEHITLDGNKLELDFLGKDSIPYYNSIEVEDDVRDNINLFIQNKDKYEQIFDKISSSDVNNYLQTFMKDLTAKVFRSYNASNLLQKELDKIYRKYPDENVDPKILLDEFNKANLKVAKLLNHQKNVAKSHKSQMEKIHEKIHELKNSLRKERSQEKKNTKKIKKIKEQIKSLKDKKKNKEETKNIALGTSKENYIDPRITVAFMKKYKLPIDKLFSTKLQKKFKWAFEVDENYHF